MTLENDCWIEVKECCASLPLTDKPLEIELLRTSVAYAGYRIDWRLKTGADRTAKEIERTRAHDAFIDAANALSRACARGGLSQTWRAQWGQARQGEQRRRIGDFACYIAWQLSLEAR